MGSCDALLNLLQRLSRHAVIAECYKAVTEHQGDTGSLVRLYRDCMDKIESCLWTDDFDSGNFACYQQAFREMETLQEQSSQEQRHHFVIVIPVADRPQHLRSCLQSVLDLCEKFYYGGKDAQGFRYIQVLIADDSQQLDNIQQHRKLARQYRRQGLTTEYFGVEEQLAAIDQVSPASRKELQSVLGHTNTETFYHKGASITRNIAYLKLAQQAEAQPNSLFYFIDSDQTFQQPLNVDGKEQRVYGINYFYQLDRIFSEQHPHMLTGKVVGDPPVSPAVMAGKFLEDVLYFLHEMAGLSPDADCDFHVDELHTGDDASYHDMAELFGFGGDARPFRFVCSCNDRHSHVATFSDFAERLSHFFDGEHPTRKSWYRYGAARQLVSARTVYTGNYIFDVRSLKYFIPFAGQKLRMAGPVLGRIVKAELGDAFVSANLPMLHSRTIEQTGQSEFRPGIERGHERIDLSGEYERQFYGDVMLFSIEVLIDQGFPHLLPDQGLIAEVVETTRKKMLSLYRQRLQQINAYLQRLQVFFEQEDHWWHGRDDLVQEREKFEKFIDNIQLNYGVDARGMQAILANSEERSHDIVNAITGYARDRLAWQAALQQVKDL